MDGSCIVEWSGVFIFARKMLIDSSRYPIRRRFKLSIHIPNAPGYLHQSPRDIQPPPRPYLHRAAHMSKLRRQQADGSHPSSWVWAHFPKPKTCPPAKSLHLLTSLGMTSFFIKGIFSAMHLAKRRAVCGDKSVSDFASNKAMKSSLKEEFPRESGRGARHGETYLRLHE